jgi:AbrB family looped-hinge helix DNA binding protein
MANTVNRKGQVTIPKAVRDHLGIRPGGKVRFDLLEDGRIVLVHEAAVQVQDRFERLRGILPSDLTTDQIMAMLREPI